MLNALTNEEAVAGAILIDESCLSAVTAILTESDFAYERPRAIFKAAVTLSAMNEPIDPITISEKMRANGFVADTEYLMRLISSTPTAANVEAYATLVKADSRRRSLRGIADEIAGRLDSGIEPDEVTSDVFSMLDEMERSTPNGLVSGSTAIQEFFSYRAELERTGAKTIVRTGYQNLDNILGGGLVNGGLYVIGARPGSGKTSLAMCLLDNIASTGMPTLFVSLEMTRLELTAKRLSRESGVTYNTVLMRLMGDTEYKAVNEASSRVYTLPVTITDKPHMTVNDIALAARRVKGLKCMCIDYFGLISPNSRKQSRYEQMTEIIDDLKRLAKTLNIPILCLAQLNRENENRADHRPKLSDLRETGAVEQSADAVIFVHREQYYDTAAEQSDSELMELIVAKNRHGRVGTANMIWFGATGRVYAQHNE